MLRQRRKANRPTAADTRAVAAPPAASGRSLPPLALPPPPVLAPLEGAVEAVSEAVGEGVAAAVAEAVGEVVAEGVAEAVGEVLGEVVAEGVCEAVGEVVAEANTSGCSVDEVAGAGVDGAGLGESVASEDCVGLPSVVALWPPVPP